jgi:hypothetical protein
MYFPSPGAIRRLCPDHRQLGRKSVEIGLNVTGGKLRSNRILRHHIEIDAIFCAEGTNDKGSADRSTL